MKTRKFSFAPIVDAHARVLVLGSLPGAKSLELGQYYGDPRNQFWTILYGVFGRTQVDTIYEDKVRFVKAHGIALWDTIRAAEREGSLDASIRNAKPNDIPALLEQYPNIERIVVGGRKAAQMLHTHFPQLIIPVFEVPSTSPIPGRYIKTLEEKMMLWKQAICVQM